MKKNSVVIIVILCIAVSTCSVQGFNDSNEKIENWTGSIRIEGKTDTVWAGIVTVSDSNISVKNVSSGEMEQHCISYPSVLGAFDEASKIDGFTYTIDYWPDWNAYIIKSVKSDSEWWHYWVDYALPMVCVGTYELSNSDSEIIIGYLEDWEAHVLKISVDKTEVKKGEEFTVNVRNETNSNVQDAIVKVGSNSFTTDSNGNVTVKLTKKGSFDIFSEKDGFVRSEKENIQVKTKAVSKNIILNHLMQLISSNQKLILFFQQLFQIFK